MHWRLLAQLSMPHDSNLSGFIPTGQNGPESPCLYVPRGVFVTVHSQAASLTDIEPVSR